MNNEERFNRKYKADPGSFGTPPLPAVVKAVEQVNGIEVLELGVGNGRNAKYILEKSLQLTGVDTSEEGLKLLRESIGENSNMDLILSDALDFQTDKRFDLVVATGLLHFFELEDIEKLLEKMAKWTKPGGLNVVIARMTQNNRGDLPHIFAEDELRGMYEKLGWDVEYYEEIAKEDRKMASVIARKPSRK